MILFDFESLRPETIEEAVTLLGQQAEAKLLAGGTDLLPNMRIEVVRPSHLVSLAGVAPDAPEEMPDGSLRIDALSRLSSLENDELVERRAPMLGAAAHSVGGNQVRQMGTLGGNLCQETRCLYYNQQHDYQFVADCYKRGGECCYPFPGNDDETCWSVFCSDLAPALIALDAEVEILGADGQRRQALEDLYSGDGMRPLTLGPAEIVTAIVVPPAPAGSGWGFHKTTLRGGLEFGMVVMAVALRLEDDGQTCAEARIVLGAIGEGPLRPRAAEAALQGAILDIETITRAADEASDEINPLPHHGYTKRYLRDNVRVYLRRSLERALERAHGA